MTRLAFLCVAASLMSLISKAYAQSGTLPFNELSPFNPDKPGPTPAFKKPPPPSFLTIEQVEPYVAATNIDPQRIADAAEKNGRGKRVALGLFGSPGKSGDAPGNASDDNNAGGSDGAVKRQAGGLTRRGKGEAKVCIDSRVDQDVINSLFAGGGAGTVVELCQNARLDLTAPIQFTAANQVLQTQGRPSGNGRATLKLVSTAHTGLIFAFGQGLDYVELRSVILDGNRAELGQYQGASSAIIEMGGNTVGQVVSDIYAFDPRGWSCLHLIEGYQLACSGVQVSNSQFGPAGNAPSGAQQFRQKRRITVALDKRQGNGNQVYEPGEWADGISLACKNSQVQGNLITDATDGAIVIFGAPGSTVSGNRIVAVSRNLLGGINLVDFMPFSGDYSHVLVSGNTINAEFAMIKVGVAIGPLTWGTWNDTAARTIGPIIQGNTFTSGRKGYLGFGIAVAGADATTVASNDFSGATFDGQLEPYCISTVPPPTSVIVNPYATSGLTIRQSDIVQADFNLAICVSPINV